MARIIGLACGLWIAGSAFAMPLRGQEFLKQLENRLRDAAGKQNDPPPPESSGNDASEREPEVRADAVEELPLPGSKPSASAPPTKPRQPPIVITPKKKPAAPPSAAKIVPTDPEPQGDVYLGLTLEPLAGGNFGLAVVEVAPQSPAWKGGFRVGDRVIGVGGQAVTTIDQFASALEGYAPGEPIKILVQRQGRSVNLTAVLQGRGRGPRIQDTLPEPMRRSTTPYQPISGALTSDGSTMLGISVSNLSEPFRQQFGIPVFRGASISEVVVGSPAERAGLRPGDCIVEIDGGMIHFADDVVDAIRASRAGGAMQIGFYRGQQKRSVEVILASDANGDAETPMARGPTRDMLTPEYVSALQAEIARLHEELEAMRSRVSELESRLPSGRR